MDLFIEKKILTAIYPNLNICTLLKDDLRMKIADYEAKVKQLKYNKSSKVNLDTMS